MLVQSFSQWWIKIFLQIIPILVSIIFRKPAKINEAYFSALYILLYQKMYVKHGFTTKYNIDTPNVTAESLPPSHKYANDATQL